MIDPNDFVDNNKPEGESAVTPKTGGVSIEQAGEAYKTASKQHFSDNLQHKKRSKKTHLSLQAQQTQRKKSLPQIGSIEDSERYR